MCVGFPVLNHGVTEFIEKLARSRIGLFPCVDTKDALVHLNSTQMSRTGRHTDEKPLPPLYAMTHGGIESIAADEITRDLGGEVKRTARGLVVFRVNELTDSVLSLRISPDLGSPKSPKKETISIHSRHSPARSTASQERSASPGTQSTFSIMELPQVCAWQWHILNG